MKVLRGDSLHLLRDLPSESVDAVITDPPYSSGGVMRSDRNGNPSAKYVQSGARLAGADFTGDNRDQRSYGYWCSLWLSECLRIARPGRVAAVFTDWRQLPTTTDALQAGGWVWRGIAVWHKTTARPLRGGFRNAAEYIVWGSKGPLQRDHEVYLPGVITTAIARGATKLHITAKPVDLMRELVKVCPEGGTVLDPFAGSGSTGMACKEEGRQFVGVELSGSYAEVADERLAA